MLIVAFKCEIPDEEIAYLNMHVAAIEDGYIDLDRSGLVERTIVDWLRSVLTDYDNQLLRNLTLHLRPALVRIKNGKLLRFSELRMASLLLKRRHRILTLWQYLRVPTN
ncbi:hypothetical protein WP50_03815 [Lactiplantibacillus plantarum]|nr:hypothetical protein WP50_03815 [Lactiplantibacillus plantarum]